MSEIPGSTKYIESDAVLAAINEDWKEVDRLLSGLNRWETRTYQRALRELLKRVDQRVALINAKTGE